MNKGSLVYDITRLMSRVMSRTPNGIDRVDFALADYFLNPDCKDRSGLVTTPLGPRILSPAASRDALDSIHRHWGEDESPEDAEHFQQVAAVLTGAPEKMTRMSKGRGSRLSVAARWIGRHGVPLGRAPGDFLADGGAYINVSQYPLWIDRHFNWLGDRPDVRGVFFIHDLLPLEMPEYFRARELSRYAQRLRTLARYGHAAIVSTEMTRDSLGRRLAALGRAGMPILVAPLPSAPIFAKPEPCDPALSKHPYFVLCGTIEPRKNHLLILQVWRDLVAQLGGAAPKLVVIGERGWENENVVDLLERCPGLQLHVIEISGLSTPSVKRLLLGARALLMPSFAEGYGLPVVEALAAGVPVIASDIAVFREIGGGRIATLDPTDGPGWRETIRAFAVEDSPKRHAALLRLAGYEPPEWSHFFAAVERFIADL
jgi:glycosyltransferase involved in cell wall biosynthesis